MRMSQVLSALAEEPGDRVSLQAILGALSDRSFAILVVLLGLPNCLPMPPPIPAISSLLLIMVAAQMAVLRRAPWLPHRLLLRSVARADLAKTVRRALPFVGRLERWSQPRWNLFEQRTGAVLKVAPVDRAANLATYMNPDLPLAPGIVDAIARFVRAHPGGRR